MNFYKHHLGDYDGHTAHLSWDEDMAYTRLMRAYYRRELPIPQAEIYRLTRAQSKAQRQAVDVVLAEFFTLQDGNYRNKRCDEEIAQYQAQASTNKRIARERIVRRTVNESLDEPSTNHSPNQIPEPETRNQITPKAEARATRLPADWHLPVDWFDWAIGERRDLQPDDISRIACQFKDYWIAKPGKDGRKLDWEATWRNWIRNDRTQSRSRSTSGTARAILALENMK